MKKYFLFMIVVLIFYGCESYAGKIKILPDVKITIDSKDELDLLIAEYGSRDNDLSIINKDFHISKENIKIINQTGSAYIDNKKLIPQDEGIVKIYVDLYDGKSTLISDLSKEITIKKDLFLNIFKMSQMSNIRNIAVGKNGIYLYGSKVRQDFSLDSSVKGISYISNDKKTFLFAPLLNAAILEMHENNKEELVLTIFQTSGTILYNKSTNSFTESLEKYDYENILSKNNLSVKYKEDYLNNRFMEVNSIIIEKKMKSEENKPTSITINGFMNCRNIRVYDNKLLFIADPSVISGLSQSKYQAIFQINLDTFTVDWMRTTNTDVLAEANTNGIIFYKNEEPNNIAELEYKIINLNK